MYTDEYGVQFSDDKKQLIRASQNLEGDYVIPSDVTRFMTTHIDVWGFFGCKKLTSVVIPDTVTCLGNYAFAKCRKLQKVVLPKNLERIEKGLFKDCESLVDIQIPEGVVSIEECAFEGCTSLHFIRIPQSVQHIGKNAFRYCDNLEEIDIPEDKSVFAFRGCPGYEKIRKIPYADEYGVGYSEDRKTLLRIPAEFKGEYIIPNGTEVLDFEALDGCRFITGLTISDSISEIQPSFEDCTSLENIHVSEKNTDYLSIDGVLFDKSKKNLIRYPIGKQQSAYSVPEGVEIIEDSAFAYCPKLESIHIPDSVNMIQYAAFEGCERLKAINVPTDYCFPDMGAFNLCEELFKTETYKKLLAMGYKGDLNEEDVFPYPDEYGLMHYEDEKGYHIYWYEGDRLVEIAIYLKSESLEVNHRNRSIDGGVEKTYVVEDIAQLMKSLEVDNRDEIIYALVYECETPHAFDLRRFFEFLQIHHVKYKVINIGTYEVTFDEHFVPLETFVPDKLE